MRSALGWWRNDVLLFRLDILLVALILAEVAWASPDPRLIALIPPGVELVSGIGASSHRGQPANFVLMTGNDKLDLADFYGLTGSDNSRHIHQAVFVAASDASGMLNGHSLLVSGNFNKDQIFRTAVKIGGTITGYRGLEVAEIQPFERERQQFNEARWLAVVDSSVLIFGSIALVRQELDRFLAHSHASESLVRRLSRLRGKDQTWCVLAGKIGNLSFPRWGEEIRSTLADINPDLANDALAADEFEFGLFYGRKVELEYFLSRASAERDKSREPSSESSSIPQVRSTALLPALSSNGPARGLHDVIVIPVPRFQRWLTKISTH